MIYIEVLLRVYVKVGLEPIISRKKSARSWDVTFHYTAFPFNYLQPPPVPTQLYPCRTSSAFVE